MLLLQHVFNSFPLYWFRGVDFEGSTVGLANTNAMCTANSGAVNEVSML